jgi:hypothetical protein
MFSVHTETAGPVLMDFSDQSHPERSRIIGAEFFVDKETKDMNSTSQRTFAPASKSFEEVIEGNFIVELYTYDLNESGGW